MTVQCANCGEELMGAVNRCWRCGQEFVARNTAGDLPPIRQRPVVDAAVGVLVAELSEPGPTAEAMLGKASELPTNPPSTWVRRGSPFGDRGRAIMEAIESDARRKQDDLLERDTKHRSGGAAASAALSVPLAMISFLAAFLLPLAGTAIALFGIGLGVWGLFSRRRGFATIGLLLCCLSLTVSSINSVVEIYVSFYGVAPWERDTSLP